MLRKYPWYLAFLIFVILCLGNIFQKMQWQGATDNIQWDVTESQLVCRAVPPDCPIKPGDILISVNKYRIPDIMALNRVISKKNICHYYVERDGLMISHRIPIVTIYAPLSYYILAFCGILMIMLALRILNINLERQKGFTPPAYFYFLTLTFSGFLIFSPTGSYNTVDFIFLVLDKLSFLFFPALLIHYALYFPIKSRLLRRFRPKFLRTVIYLPPLTILFLNVYGVVGAVINQNTAELTGLVSHYRRISLYYFGVYLTLAMILFVISNLTLILMRKEKRFILPLAGIVISIQSLVFFHILFTLPELFKNLSLLLLLFLPLGITYLLGHRKFSDIENVIKKSVSVSFIFPFIFGIYFFLGSSFEQNKLLGLFWSISAILTAGLLYKPIEATVHNYMEKFFFRGAYNFKRKIKELIESLPTERDLGALSTGFLNTINNGFQLQKSSFIIHHRKNVFYALPRNEKILLSKNFRTELFQKNNLILFSASEFARKFPKDYKLMKDLNYFQFLPLKTPDKLIGLVAFGPKTDNTYLSVEDWELLFNISGPLSLSVENASLYSELRTQVDEISLLKEFNENIIKNISLGIVVLSGLNIVKTWNNIMEQKFKVPAAKAINRKAYKLLGIDLWKRIYRQKTGIANLESVPMDIQGREVIFDIYISPLKDSSGKRIGTILVFEDVTEKVLIRSQLITSEKMASLGLLSAGIAHEVNTPLTGISSYCQLILDEPENPENIELIHKVQEQVIRANKIIRTLLDFSRQKGEQPVQLDLGKVIDESISLVDHKLKQRAVELKKDFQFKSRIYGFSTRLQQLFINLILNAVDATPEDGGSISIYGTQSDDRLTVRIKDNGKGIAQKDLEKIFDPFFTTKEQGKGTGLGLSIVYAIVEEHYGEITANSKLDRGTTFTIHFPLESPLRSIKL